MPPVTRVAPNNFHHALSSNPMRNIATILDNMETAQRNVSANQSAQALSAFGIPFSGLLTHLTQNNFIIGLMRTFFSYWVDRQKDIQKDMHDTNKLADRAQ